MLQDAQQTATIAPGIKSSGRGLTGLGNMNFLNCETKKGHT
jgi:hypothetical protein